MKINETTTAFDLAESLRDEHGVFIVSAPDHGVYLAESQVGHSLTSLRQIRPAPAGAQPSSGWQVTKISEQISEESSSSQSRSRGGLQPSTLTR